VSLCQRLSTVSQQSWHYRLVVRVHKLLGDPLEINSACGYWLGLLPLCVITAIILLAAALAFGATLLFELGWLILQLIREPLHSLWIAGTFIVFEASVCTVLLGLCVGIDWVISRLKRLCQPLQLVE
jgi:hypothetical protein